VFRAALECAPAERGAVLDEQCGGDAALRGEVERLLARDAEAEGAGFLPPPGPPGGGEGGSRPFPLALRELDVHLRCPHCPNPIELDALPASGEALCPQCGSTFRLEAGSTTTCGGAARGRKLGRFELVAAVGSGTFGTVYKARDPQLDRIVAVKVPRA